MFQVGDEIRFCYALTNTSDNSIDYYNDNCPMMSCVIYTSDDVEVGVVSDQFEACIDNIPLKTIASKITKQFTADWSDNSANGNLPLGNY